MTNDQTLQPGGKTIDELRRDIVDVYRADNRPWVIGYSGGKDSTAVLRLIYETLSSIPEAERSKPVFLVSSDTLVETPIVVGLITETLAKLRQSSIDHKLPFSVPSQVTPKTGETFWANLIGRGYPAPTRQFRWCTERMKIDPVSAFILDKVAEFGEVVVVLGSRIAESSSRAQVMKKHKIEGRRLAHHSTLPNAFVYTPIEDWTADDVWEYLFSGPAPWGGDHQALFDLYKDSNAGECPLVLDTSTPSCGNSRFGCWVCTVVTKDKAMDGLIESGHRWLVPLQQFRNMLYETTLPENKHKFRSDKRRSGKVTVVFGDDKQAKKIFGPYRMDVRKDFLRKLLEAQKIVVIDNPGEPFDLITKAELEEIRILWRTDPIEPDWADSVPKIYAEVFGNEIQWASDDDATFSKLESEVLSQLENRHGIAKELVMKLVELELSMEGLSKRASIFQRIEDILAQDWGNTEDSVARHTARGHELIDRDKEEESLSKTYKAVSELLNHAT